MQYFKFLSGKVENDLTEEEHNRTVQLAFDIREVVTWSELLRFYRNVCAKVGVEAFVNKLATCPLLSILISNQMIRWMMSEGGW